MPIRKFLNRFIGGGKAGTPKPVKAPERKAKPLPEVMQMLERAERLDGEIMGNISNMPREEQAQIMRLALEKLDFSHDYMVRECLRIISRFDAPVARDIIMKINGRLTKEQQNYYLKRIKRKSERQ